jgi:hypothetical protein
MFEQRTAGPPKVWSVAVCTVVVDLPHSHVVVIMWGFLIQWFSSAFVTLQVQSTEDAAESTMDDLRQKSARIQQQHADLQRKYSALEAQKAAVGRLFCSKSPLLCASILPFLAARAAADHAVGQTVAFSLRVSRSGLAPGLGPGPVLVLVFVPVLVLVAVACWRWC